MEKINFNTSCNYLIILFFLGINITKGLQFNFYRDYLYILTLRGDGMINIYTLGHFDIEIDGESILSSIESQHKLMKLFKYFLTYQGRKLLPEDIVDDLWPEDDYKDPLSVLRTQISRVRKMIDFKRYGIGAFFEIIYTDGYYTFKLDDNCMVDFLLMQECIQTYHSKADKKKVLEKCRMGVDLYKGEYLRELGLEDWIIPIRNRFDRLYVNNLSHYLKSLQEMSMDNLIISICEEAMTYKPYEESIHLYFIDSLLNLGQSRCALNHYNYFTSKLHHDLEMPPSNQLRELYKKIKSHEDSSLSTVSLSNIEDELREKDELEGALICDKDYFKLLYNIAFRFNERKRRKSFVGIISIGRDGFKDLSKKDLKGAMSVLLDVAFHGLRKGDVISRWNDEQVLLLLYDMEEDNLNKIIDRIRTSFNDMIKDKKVNISIKFKSF